MFSKSEASLALKSTIHRVSSIEERKTRAAKKNHDRKVAECSVIETHYPVWKSCSFLAINFYEETSNKFEEYCSAALIPECSSLLNDELYPLYNIDEFYWTPWNTVEYDAEFFKKEASKLEEKLSKICSSVYFSIEANDDNNNEQEQDVESLFSDINFQELNLQVLKNDDERFLEVPQIPNSILQLENKTTPDQLLRNIPKMELPVVFKEKEVMFEDSAIIIDDDSMTQIEDEPSLEDFENFKEIVLPMINERDIKLEDLSNNPQDKNLFCHSKINDSHKTVSFVSLNEVNKQSQNLENTNNNLFKSKDYANFSSEYSKNNSIGACSMPRKTFYTSLENHNNLRNLKRKIGHESENDKYQENLYESEYCSSEEFTYENISVIDDDNKGNENDSKSVVYNDKISDENYDSFSDVYNDEFFSENCLDFGSETEDDQDIFYNRINESNKEFSSNVYHNTEDKITDLNIPQVASSKSFLTKLSKLDLMKVERNINNDCISEESDKGSNSMLKGSTVIRSTINDFQQNNRIDESNSLKPTSVNQNVIPSRDVEIVEKNSSQSHSLRSFDLLSSYDYVRNKDDTPWSLNSSPSFSQKTISSLGEKSKVILKNLTDFNYDNSSNLKERELLSTTSERNNLHLLDEDVSVQLPDDYIQLILAYEKATTFYIQRLALWEGFQLSFDLTILDISLDKTRFLLNQEVKNCQDRNISPLEGGISYSHYIQLLMLHGILKSLNCLIHFGLELALLSLSEFEKKHGIVQGFFGDLIEQVSLFSEKLTKTHSVHPKIEKISLYLQEKYYYCKENIIPFKVLIVLKEHLAFFYSSFEAFMKTLLPEIIIDMIPECSVLEQEADKFSGCKEYIYVARASSISKHVLWQELTLFVEYESDSNACWKTNCKVENVAHIHIKFDTLPVKTLNEIKNLQLLKEPSFKTYMETRKIPIVVSASISLEYNLRSFLDEKSNVCIYERSYKKYLPDMDFADITIGFKTCILVINLMMFLRIDAYKNLIDKLFNLQQKYEVIWLIIQDNTEKNINNECIYEIQTNYFNFYYMTTTMKSQCSVKVKILFAKTDEAVKNWIASILMRRIKCSPDEFECFQKYNLSSNMTEEELFLMSFPSLNPIATSFLLSGKASLNDVLNLNLEELYERYQYVPGRFLKHFHLLAHKKITHSSEPLEDNMIYCKSDKISRNLQPQSQLQKRSSNADELVNFINCLEKYAAKENVKSDFSVEPYKNETLLNKASVPVNFTEMTLEDIDRDYKALKLRDTEYASFDVGFDINSSPACLSYPSNISDEHLPESPSNSLKSEKNYIHSQPENDLNLFCVKENHKYTLNESSLLRSSFKGSEPAVLPNFDYSFGNDNNENCDNSFHFEEKNLCANFKVQKLNISQYRFNKRKSDSEMLSQNKFMKYSSPQYSMFQTSPRLQKGQASKTVCKRVTFKSLSSTNLFEDKISSSSTDSFQDNTSQFKTISFSQGSDSPSYGNLDSSWLMQDKVTLTPVENRKLTYEKVPGKKGQTRLVFHQ